MAQFLGISGNVLIFTDSTFTAGGITRGAVPATILTRGATLLLRDIFFPEAGEDARVEPLSFQAVGARVAEATSASGAKQDDTSSLAAGLTEIPHLVSLDSHPALGQVAMQEFEDSGAVELASGTSVFRPAGKLYSRQVGPNKMWFAVANESLVGIVEPNSGLTALTTDVDGVQLRDVSVVRSGSGCGSCGACGACGLCTFCGELNLGSGVAAAVAVTAFAALGEVKKKPIFESAESDRPSATYVLEEVNRRLGELGLVANAVNDDWDIAQP
jgi:hypothetical protein